MDESEVSDQVEKMIAFMRFNGDLASDEEAERVRADMAAGMERGAQAFSRLTIAENVSTAATAFVAAFILLASFVTFGLLLEPWLGARALLLGLAYIVAFFWLNADRKDEATAFT
jgi:hypothetical protein